MNWISIALNVGNTHTRPTDGGNAVEVKRLGQREPYRSGTWRDREREIERGEGERWGCGREKYRGARERNREGRVRVSQCWC